MYQMYTIYIQIYTHIYKDVQIHAHIYTCIQMYTILAAFFLTKHNTSNGKYIGEYVYIYIYTTRNPLT